MTHDFKGALKSLYSLNEGMGFINPDSHYGKHCETVSLALLIADRLQSGEVSGGVVQAIMSSTNPMSPNAPEIFKAMTAQMIKEIENDTE